MIAARETLLKFTNAIYIKFKILKKIEEITQTFLKYTIYILRTHLYGNENQLLIYSHFSLSYLSKTFLTILHLQEVPLYFSIVFNQVR